LITVKFKIKKDVYEFTAKTPLDAMEMCSRQVYAEKFQTALKASGKTLEQMSDDAKKAFFKYIDKLDPPSYMSWAKSGPNEYTYVHGDFFN